MTDEIADLRRRLQTLEDERDIQRLIASYGPAVDTGNATATAQLWAENGSYTVVGYPPFVGAEAVGDLVTISSHQGYLQQGCAHVMSSPVVTLDGDRASAICYSRLYLHEGENWIVARVSANHWDLIRTADGWRVQERTNRLLDGAVEAQALLS